ncbi:MAG: efflux RND transporter periplasmic adaptor subunit [Actinomycetota bacterium]|nr:efflux RND transporter periplasmic adaptor subunit [Actinomycetota bacterium]
MSRKTKIIIAVVALLTVGGTAAVIALGAQGAVAAVETTTVVREDLVVTITAAGLVESGVRMEIYPPTAGVLEEVYVKDGETVSAGAIVARMEEGPLEATVKQASAGLAQAEAQLAGVDDRAPSSDDLAAARAGTDAAWAGYLSAQKAAGAVADAGPSAAARAAAQAAASAAWTGYSSAKPAYDLLKASVDASASPSPSALAELDQAKGARDQAYAGYLQAKAALSSLEDYDGTSAEAQADSAARQAYAAYLSARAQQSKLEGSSVTAERAAAQAAVDQARLGLVLAEDNLDRATLVAPIDGVVFFNPSGAPGPDGSVPVPAAGSPVAPQAAPFTVVDLDGLRLTADVDEVDIDRIELGMKARVMLDAFPEKSFETTVSEIKSAAKQTATGGTVFPVHLSLSSPDADVLIGMKGDANVEVNIVAGATTIPVEALFDEGGTTFVYIVEDNLLVRTKVEVGTLTETTAQVLSGVDVGDEVALSGATELVDGMRIRIAN